MPLDKIGMNKNSNKLLIASSNKGKVWEYRKHLADLPLELVSLDDVGLGSIEETGKTFEENAILKAKTYFEQSGLPCIADDGGLVIDYLNGEPGIYSRRWKTGDENVTDEELIAYTLERMQGVPDEKRIARMSVAVAFVDIHGQAHTVSTATEGVIAHKAADHWQHGLPYRAVLFVPKFNKLFCDFTEEENEQVNQRVLAIEKLRPVIKEKLL